MEVSHSAGFGAQSPLAPSESFVTLEQNIHPNGPVPMGVKGLIRGLCAQQCKNLMDDLRSELQKRKGEFVDKPVVDYHYWFLLHVYFMLQTATHEQSLHAQTRNMPQYHITQKQSSVYKAQSDAVQESHYLL